MNKNVACAFGGSAALQVSKEVLVASVVEILVRTNLLLLISESQVCLIFVAATLYQSMLLMMKGGP